MSIFSKKPAKLNLNLINLKFSLHNYDTFFMDFLKERIEDCFLL